MEGHVPKYVYIVLEGSLALFKRPESMYDAQGRLIKVHEIELQVNPKHSGDAKIGQRMTTVRAGLLGEDAIIFDQPLPYSIKTDERCVVLRTPTEDAKKWPIDIHNALKMKSLDKYKVFYT